MNPVLHTAATLSDRLRELVQQADEIQIAVAWASASNAVHEPLLAAQARVSALTVGIHFHQTDPDFLKAWAFEGTPLRIVRDVRGTFHPKVFLFRTGESGVALVGSANLTAGGTALNTEAIVELQGKWSERLFEDLRALTTASGHDRIEPTDAWLAAYRTAYLRRHAARDLLGTADEVLGPDTQTWLDLHLDFDDYVERLRQPHPSGYQLTDWLDALDTIHSLPGWPDTRRLSERDWRYAMGVRKYHPDDADGANLWFFGRLFPVGTYPFIADHAARHACEHIPLTGTVSPRAWGQFATLHASHFDSDGVGTASRILTLRRPDLFMPVNDKNRERVEQALGVTVHDLDTYWQLHQRIWRLPWAASPEPPTSSPTHRIWAARVALLDALFYDP